MDFCPGFLPQQQLLVVNWISVLDFFFTNSYWWSIGFLSWIFSLTIIIGGQSNFCPGFFLNNNYGWSIGFRSRIFFFENNYLISLLISFFWFCSSTTIIISSYIIGGQLDFCVVLFLHFFLNNINWWPNGFLSWFVFGFLLQQQLLVADWISVLDFFGFLPNNNYWWPIGFLS